MTNLLILFVFIGLFCGGLAASALVLAPFFEEVMDLPNVYLPQRFWNVLNKDNANKD